MSEDKNPSNPHHNKDEEDEDYNLGKEAAGVVRGVSRSIARAPMRSIARAPMIGRLPRHVIRQRLPVKQVARFSDRLATGLDWWSSAVESSSEGRQPRWTRIRSFAGSLLRNTLLGMAVFESYGYIVGYLAPSEDESFNDTNINRTFLDDDDDSENHIIYDAPDEYARASISAHLGAGYIAGSIHGVAISVMEDNFARQDWLRKTTLGTIHHSLAHSLLFGSYEFIKRSIVQELHVFDESTQYFGGAYLAGFGIAGGMAGQIQHLFSHYTEHAFGLANSTLRLSTKQVVAPQLRPLFWSFPPSAIGFIAFEYGKKLVS
jgi:hypothetical protein